MTYRTKLMILSVGPVILTNGLLATVEYRRAQVPAPPMNTGAAQLFDSRRKESY